jgi:hypothetical protein
MVSQMKLKKVLGHAVMEAVLTVSGSPTITMVTRLLIILIQTGHLLQITMEMEFRIV